jgi:hypothetical protein
MTIVWPVMVLVRHIVTTMSAKCPYRWAFSATGRRALSRSDMRVIALEAWTAPLMSADHSNSL